MAGLFNLAAFKRIAAAALLAGVLAGLLLTAVQRIQVIPILLQAEVYEDNAAHVHANADDAHHHDAEAWKPENGWERTFYTAMANVSLAIGFALLLSAAMALRGGATSWRSGLLWGLAGYTIFFVAPALGLPPEVPGSEAAPLAERQLWWMLAVGGTSVGLALLLFARSTLMKILGVALLVVPHLIGAPQPAIHASTAPQELAHTFIFASALANAVLWLALGAFTGFFYHKLAYGWPGGTPT
jgi:cobalt transporter subunit CbtA